MTELLPAFLSPLLCFGRTAFRLFSPDPPGCAGSCAVPPVPQHFPAFPTRCQHLSKKRLLLSGLLVVRAVCRDRQTSHGCRRKRFVRKGSFYALRALSGWAATPREKVRASPWRHELCGARSRLLLAVLVQTVAAQEVSGASRGQKPPPWGSFPAALMPHSALSLCSGRQELCCCSWAMHVQWLQPTLCPRHGTQLRTHSPMASHIALMAGRPPLLFVTGSTPQSSLRWYTLQHCLAIGCSTAGECGARPAAAGSRDILVALMRVRLFASPAATPSQPAGNCVSQRCDFW